MPQTSASDAQEKELRRQMREGRTPLIEAVAAAYKPYLMAKKTWGRKNDELREQVGLLSSEFDSKGKLLRESSHKSELSAFSARGKQRRESPGKSADSGLGMIESYQALSRQAKAVSSYIDKELPNLTKLYEPVAAAFAVFEAALAAYTEYMASWEGKLPDGDLRGRALELALEPIERALR